MPVLDSVRVALQTIWPFPFFYGDTTMDDCSHVGRAATENAAITTQQSTATPRLLMNVRGMAKALGISEHKLWELKTRGAIPHVRIDGEYFMHRKAVGADDPC